MGIDYGERRTGLALSDATGSIASGYKTLAAAGPAAAARAVAAEIAAERPVAVIVGYPVSADGGAGGERCRAVDRFIGELQKLSDVPIHREDERDSSAEARSAIHAHGKKVSRKRRAAGSVDVIAATIILQRWLNDRPRR
ncbi:MAG TPA: Holliday junction resolvase RuvX [candidate division Zixibacteria bacterium]|nr:Holliday junction resolvase RuvX [candidate division Zixibacteria bacterium]